MLPGKRRKKAWPEAALRTRRKDFGLCLANFATMKGIPEKSLVAWENGKAASLDEEALARLRRVAGILGGLARVVRRAFIPTWLEQPNDACKETGAGTPLDLFARGDYDTLEDMVWYLESGTPGYASVAFRRIVEMTPISPHTTEVTAIGRAGALGVAMLFSTCAPRVAATRATTTAWP